MFRRVVRFIFRIVTFVSAFLLLITLDIWPVSHFREVSVSYCKRDGSALYLVVFFSGRLIVGREIGLHMGDDSGLSIRNPQQDEWSYATWMTRGGGWERGFQLWE